MLGSPGFLLKGARWHGQRHSTTLESRLPRLSLSEVLIRVGRLKIPRTSTPDQIRKSHVVLIELGLYIGKQTLGQAYLNGNKLFSLRDEIQGSLARGLHVFGTAFPELSYSLMAQQDSVQTIDLTQLSIQLY